MTKESGDTSKKEVSTTSTPQFHCSMLKPSNYSLWEIRMQIILEANGLWEMIEPLETTQADNKKDKTVIAFLYQALPEEQLLQITKHKTAKAIWDALKTRHIGEQRVQQARLQTLKSDFEMLHMTEDETIDTFTKKLTTLANKAAKRIKYKKGKQVVNQEKLMFTRHESKGKYFRGRGCGKHRFSQGNPHEKFKEERKDGKSSHRNSNRNNFKKSSYDTSKLQCFQCKKIRHIAPNCPQRTKANKQSNLVKEDLEPTLLMAILEDPDEGKQVKEVEEQKVSLHKEDVGYKETNMDSLWYLDNGASNHMTGVREYFKELDEKVNGKVRFEDGSYIEIKGKAYAKVPSQRLTKLDDRSSRMIYLGNEQGSKAYRLFDPTTQKICVRRDVKFKENETWDWKEYISEHINDESKWTDFKIENLEVTSDHHNQETQPIKEDNEFPNNDDDGYASPTISYPLHSQTPHTPSTRSSQVNYQVTPNTSTQSIYQSDSGSISTTNSHSHFDHTSLRGYRTLNDLYENTEELLLAENEPKNYKEASSDQKWIEAMKVELDSINRNNTWELTTLPKGHKAIGLKWVFKTKKDANGNIIKHKARLVAKG
nr:zinc finger, CCHC-type [Tanacetum cinerariifolium]